VRPFTLALWLLAGALGGCAGTLSSSSLTTTAPDGASERIPMFVSKPDGAGPFPAVVIVHDCSGLGPRSSGGPDRWARDLVSRGYVVIMPDSFSTRGFPDGVCTDPSPTRADVGPGRRARDAYAALAYARTLAYVDGRRVGLMGGSHGGSTTLIAMSAPERDGEPLARDKQDGFRAAVALYPGCAAQLQRRRAAPGAYKPIAPLLILVGEKDDWTPAEPCRQLAAASAAAGYPVRITVYPDAHHSFDSDRPVRFVEARVNPNSPTGRGATTGGNREAWSNSIREVTAFFAANL
jgi:dienelactone hydrolase